MNLETRAVETHSSSFCILNMIDDLQLQLLNPCTCGFVCEYTELRNIIILWSYKKTWNCFLASRQ